MTALILLAAGRGSRFGGGKLSARLGEKPLARHVSDRLLDLPLSRRITVCSASTPDLPGFERVLLEPADAPLSRSIAVGLAAIGEATPVLIALADMPLVPFAHFAALTAAFDGNMVATKVGSVAMVPAIFGANHFETLKNLVGDRGAGALLRDAPWVELHPSLAIDVDTADDLALAERALEPDDI